MDHWKCEVCGILLDLDGELDDNHDYRNQYLFEFRDTKENGYKHHFFCRKHGKEYMKSWEPLRLFELIDDKTDHLCWTELEWAKNILKKKIKNLENDLLDYIFRKRGWIK